VKSELNELDFEGAKRYALTQLTHNLSPELFYHNLAHTQEGVVPMSAWLAAQEGVTGEARLLLLTAAYYHDIGFTKQQKDHEAVGAEIAAYVLPRFGYTPAQIDVITGMIMATKLPQSPQTLLEKILADADLDVLGREDFFSRNRALREELEAFGHVVTDETWYSHQLKLLQTHRYFTAPARAMRGPGKRQHIRALKMLLAQSQKKPQPTTSPSYPAKVNVLYPQSAYADLAGP
jgi:uncharacterized protein